jgi:hypothetical protein
MLEAPAEPGLPNAGLLRRLRTEAGLTQEEPAKARASLPRRRPPRHADRRLLARRISATPPPSVTAAGVPSLPDGAFMVSIPAPG